MRKKMKREYTYYLPKHLLPDDEALEKFRGLLTMFVGTHSFHNYASTKGRQLKEVRKRVQASIDFKKSGGKAPATAEGGTEAAPGSDAGAEAASGDGGDAASGNGKKRWLSKEEWRTFRHKKKSAVDQKADDAWFGKPAVDTTEESTVGAVEGSSSGSGGVGQASEAAAAAGGVINEAAENTSKAGQENPTLPQGVGKEVSSVGVTSSSGVVTAAAAAATEMDVVKADGMNAEKSGGGAESEIGKEEGKEGVEVGADTAVGAETAKETGKGAEDEGPEKQIMLRELRTRWVASFCALDFWCRRFLLFRIGDSYSKPLARFGVDPCHGRKVRKLDGRRCLAARCFARHA